MAKVLLRQRVHAVHVQARVHSVGHQHRVVDRGHIYALTRENLGVIFHILPDFQNGRVFQHGF